MQADPSAPLRKRPDMNSFKLHYFLLFAVFGSILPFQPVLLNRAGLSDRDIGFLLALPGLAAIAMPPLMGYLADRHVPSRRIITLLELTLGVAFLALLVVEDRASVAALNLTLGSLMTPAVVLLDVLTLHTMRAQEGGADRSFPLIRRWGSIGFIAPAIILYPATELATLPPEVIYAIGAICALGSACTAVRLPAVPPAATARGEAPTWVALRALSRPPLRPITVAMTLLSVGLAFLYLLLPRYLQALGLSTAEIGLVISLGVGGEIVLMSIGPRYLQQFGFRAALVGGVALSALRLGALALVPAISVAIITQALHAPLILIIAIILPVILTRTASPDIRNSLSGAAASINFGITRLIGASLAGLIVTYSSGTELERICAALLFGAGLFVAATALFARSVRHLTPAGDVVESLSP